MFVHNINNIKRADLESYFVRFGEIESVQKINTYGFIKFKSPLSCAEAIKQGQHRGRDVKRGSSHYVTGVPVYCQSNAFQAKQVCRLGNVLNDN